MTRAERLIDLLQRLRRHRHPVSGASLAAEQGISLRTLYRDIASLQAQGARIDGEAGLGYLLRPGFMLPPLMFSEDELEALVLGSRWVADRADSRLSGAAASALSKIAAVLPEDLRHGVDSSALLVGPGEPLAAGVSELDVLRQAIRTEHRLKIDYTDLKQSKSSRVVWPFALAFFDRVRVMVAWCETRQAYRHFRTDRINAVELLDDRYPRRRLAMLKEWQQQEGIPSR